MPGNSLYTKILFPDYDYKSFIHMDKRYVNMLSNISKNHHIKKWLVVGEESFHYKCLGYIITIGSVMRLYINQVEDEYFYIKGYRYDSDQFYGKTNFYKCDGVDGLFEFINKIFVINYDK